MNINPNFLFYKVRLNDQLSITFCIESNFASLHLKPIEKLSFKQNFYTHGVQSPCRGSILKIQNIVTCKQLKHHNLTCGETRKGIQTLKIPTTTPTASKVRTHLSTMGLTRNEATSHDRRKGSLESLYELHLHDFLQQNANPCQQPFPCEKIKIINVNK